MDLPDKNWDESSIKWIIMDDYFIGYPLVNVYRTMVYDPPFLMGKPSISVAMFNIYVELREGSHEISVVRGGFFWCMHWFFLQDFHPFSTTETEQHIGRVQSAFHTSNVTY